MHTHYGLKSPSIMLQWEQKDLLDRFIKVTCTATCTNKRSGMRSHYFMSLPLSGCPPLFPNVACVLIQHKGHWLYFVLCFYMYMYRFLSAMFILISSLCTVPSRSPGVIRWLIDCEISRKDDKCKLQCGSQACRHHCFVSSHASPNVSRKLTSCMNSPK